MPNMHSILSRSSKTILRNNYSQEEIKRQTNIWDPCGILGETKDIRQKLKNF